MPAYLSAFLDNDGYTLPGEIAGQPGQYSAVAVRFRPALSPEWFEAQDALQALKGKARAEFVAKFLAAHLKQWDLKTGQGQPVELTEPNLARVHGRVLSGALDLVLGYAPAGEAADAKN